ncbi:sortase [Streptomyces sp. NPDC005970]|uniref:sortase domain-containing protein n=1 Tax=Streptomyces sp. NPDC005970 TaxID=3156723 RepID=UPI0033CF5494
MYGKGPGGVGRARAIAGVAWAALLLGLWLWGHDAAEGLGGAVPLTGDVAAVGRPPTHPLPRAWHPLPAAAARRVVVESAGIAAPVAGQGRDGSGGWYGMGARPGASGAAVLVGPADAGVLRRLGGVRRGDAVRVSRADGTVAEFTVEDVAMVTATRFDARRVYAARAGGRAELRLLAGGGARGGTVVVSAYLTGSR